MNWISHYEDQQNKLAKYMWVEHAEGPAAGRKQAHGVAPTWGKRKL